MTGKLLIEADVQSKIPNLALMKISGHFRDKGYQVYLDKPQGEYDEVWLSCIFTWNRSDAMSAIRMQESMGKKVMFGGTGFDWGIEDKLRRIELPPEIENRMPDYLLYPDDDRAVGFCQRGCDRECQFCDVWRKEGKIQKGYISPKLLVPADRNKFLLLDNDIALSPNHDQIINECREIGVKLAITQGYDIRCITPERAQFLAEDKPWDNEFKQRRIYIAWDYLGIENYVRKGVEMLRDAGFRADQIYCYTVCGFNTTHKQDYYRFQKLEEWGANAYVMTFNNRKDDKWLNHYARWVNRGYHRFIPFEAYKDGVLVEH